MLELRCDVESLSRAQNIRQGPKVSQLETHEDYSLGRESFRFRILWHFAIAEAENSALNLKSTGEQAPISMSCAVAQADPSPPPLSKNRNTDHMTVPDVDRYFVSFPLQFRVIIAGVR